MLDPFANALGDDTDIDFDSSGSDVAPSQVADTRQNNGNIVIECDELEHDPMEDCVMQCVDAEKAQSKVNPSAKCSKRKWLSAKETPKGLSAVSKLRRRVNPSQQIKHTPLKESTGCEIRCIFVPRKKGEQEAIPLWPQYTVAWKGADFEGYTWLILSNYSRWLHNLVNATTNKCVRNVAQHMFSVARSEFSACLAKARGSGDQDSQTLDSDSEGEETASLKHSSKNDAALTVVIGGYPVFCINTKKQIFISVDNEAVEFIRHWLLPLALSNRLPA